MSEESSPSRLRAKLMGARGEAVLQRAPDLQRHLNNTGVSSDTLLAGGNAALANLLTMDGCPTVNLGASQEEWEKELLEVGNFCRELMPVAKYLNAFSTCQSISQRTDDAALDDFKAAVARFMEDTPFHVAQQNGDGRLLVSYTYSLPIAKHLLEAEGVKEALAAAPNTLAWLAQTGVNSDIIKACIEAGAALTNETVQSESALSAVFNNYTDPDFLKFVLSKAQPEHINFARPSYGWTVLETMIRNVQADRAIMLAEAGADLFASGVYGSTAFSAVATCYDADLLTRLLAVEAIKAQLQPKAGYLFAQVTSNWNSSPSDALFDALKAAGASVNETSAGCEGFRPAIQTFVSNGYTALVRKMVDAGCDVKASIFDGASLLFSASTEEMVDLLLELGVDPRATNTNGYTAAMQAVMNYWTAAALKLIPKTDLTAVNFIGQNILHVAAHYNNVDVMRAVLATDGASALVNVKDQNGSTPLVVAISSTGNADLVNLLLEQGADPDIIANDGTSALLASTTYAAIFSSLLPKAKATLEAKDGSGRTALWRAANSSSVEAIQAALEAGADITVVDNDNANVLFAYVSGSVPLDIALLTRLLDGVTNASLARTSDNATAAVNLIPNRYSQEAFAAAFRLFAERGLLSQKTADSTSNAVGHLFRNVNYNESVIAPLIQELVAQAQAAGDLDATLTQVIGGDTVLHYAAYRGSEPENDAFNTQLKVFLDAAPHLINARRETDGRTPLIVAAAGNNPGAVQILLERGADWTAKDNNGVTALDASTTSRCAGILIQKGAKINFDTFNATLLNDDAFIEIAKDQLADLKPNAAILLAAVDTSGDCYVRRVVDKALAEKTLNVNGEVNGQTAVHRIAYAGNNVGDAQYDWMKRLIDAGADVNLVRTDGATPLLEALRGSNRGALELLLAHGSIEVNKLSQGETPLTYAVRNSKAQDIIESLLAKGADKNMANGEGKLAHELTEDATIKALVQV